MYNSHVLKIFVVQLMFIHNVVTRFCFNSQWKISNYKTCVYGCLCTYVYVCVFVRVYMCVCISVYVCVYVCLCVWNNMIMVFRFKKVLAIAY